MIIESNDRICVDFNNIHKIYGWRWLKGDGAISFLDRTSLSSWRYYGIPLLYSATSACNVFKACVRLFSPCFEAIFKDNGRSNGSGSLSLHQKKKNKKEVEKCPLMQTHCVDVGREQIFCFVFVSFFQNDGRTLTFEASRWSEQAVQCWPGHSRKRQDFNRNRRKSVTTLGPTSRFYQTEEEGNPNLKAAISSIFSKRWMTHQKRRGSNRSKMSEGLSQLRCDLEKGFVILTSFLFLRLNQRRTADAK